MYWFLLKACSGSCQLLEFQCLLMICKLPLTSKISPLLLRKFNELWDQYFFGPISHLNIGFSHALSLPCISQRIVARDFNLIDSSTANFYETVLHNVSKLVRFSEIYLTSICGANSSLCYLMPFTNLVCLISNYNSMFDRNVSQLPTTQPRSSKHWKFSPVNLTLLHDNARLDRFLISKLVSIYA